MIRRYVIIFTLLLITFATGLSEEFTPADFFPLHIGDMWLYKVFYSDTDFYYYTIEVIGDTVDSDSSHWFILSREPSKSIYYLRITDDYDVFFKSKLDSEAQLLYWLAGDINSCWYKTGDSVSGGTIGIIDTILYSQADSSEVVPNEIEIGYYGGYCDNFTLWEYSQVLVRGVGLYLEYYEGGGMTTLIGAMIDSMIYGKNPESIDDERYAGRIPARFYLYPNYPNPFNSSTTIHYQIVHSGMVTINIYNIKGQLIRKLLHDYQKQGEYRIIWDGLNNEGYMVSSGIYFYELINNYQRKVEKMVFVK